MEKYSLYIRMLLHRQKDKMQLPVRARLDMDVINNIDVSAVDSEFLQQRLHPAGQMITH